MTADQRSVQKQERRAYWRGIVEEAERSGRSIRAFCRERRIQEHLFFHWRRLLQRERQAASTGGATPAVEPRFVLVAPHSPTEPSARSSGTLELILQHGWCLRIPAGADQSTLRLVLAALAGAR